MTETREIYPLSRYSIIVDIARNKYRYVSIVERKEIEFGDTPNVYLVVASNEDLSEDEILDAAEDETWRHCGGSYRFTYKVLDE